MGIFKWIKDFLNYAPGHRGQPLSEWFEVTFDESGVLMRARPPEKEPWEQGFTWSSVTRVCYKPELPGVSDGIYVFTDARPESYVVPLEGRGGEALWNEIIRRGLFDARLAAEAKGKLSGEVYCCPED